MHDRTGGDRNLVLALHLTYTAAQTSLYDPRPDLGEHISSILPLYLPATVSVDELRGKGRLRICASLDEALAGATIVQEQDPENEAFKRETWKNVVAKVGRECRLWSSTSGISASRQLGGLDEDKSEDDRGTKWEPGLVTSARERLRIVHPFNPPKDCAFSFF